ncbi:hypothetical protein VOLCADRAFT_117462, partial [Volvox carteri f. nagariensis]
PQAAVLTGTQALAGGDAEQQRRPWNCQQSHLQAQEEETAMQRGAVSPTVPGGHGIMERVGSGVLPMAPAEAQEPPHPWWRRQKQDDAAGGRWPVRQDLPATLAAVVAAETASARSRQADAVEALLGPSARLHDGHGNQVIQGELQQQKQQQFEADLMKQQPQLMLQLHVQAARCSDLLAWAMEAALLPLDRPLPQRFTAPYEHCIQPGGELEPLATAAAAAAAASAAAATTEHSDYGYVYESADFDAVQGAGFEHDGRSLVGPHSSPAEVGLNMMYPSGGSPPPPQASSAAPAAISSEGGHVGAAPAVGRPAAESAAGLAERGGVGKPVMEDAGTEQRGSLQQQQQHNRHHQQLQQQEDLNWSHARSLLQIFVESRLPVTRTSADLPADFKLVGLLGLALSQTQANAGRNRSANSAVASTFQGTGFPFGVSFSLTNDFGGSSQHSFRFGTATDRRGAAGDGVQAGRAVSQVPFGDVNVVTDILTAALAQRRIVKLKPPPSSWHEKDHHGKDDTMDRPLKSREGQDAHHDDGGGDDGGGQSPQQAQPRDTGVGAYNSNVTMSGAEAIDDDDRVRAVNTSMTTAATAGEGGIGAGAGAGAGAGGASVGRKADDVNVDALLAEYDYWNGYMYPFYNVEYDMSYNDDDLHGDGDGPGGNTATALRDASSGVGSGDNIDGDNGIDGNAMFTAGEDKYRTQTAKAHNHKHKKDKTKGGESKDDESKGDGKDNKDDEKNGTKNKDDENKDSPYTAYLYDPFDVLMATTLEYGRAGQYNYFYAQFYRFLNSYYSGPQIVPQTGLARTRSTSAAVRDDKATTSGSSKNAATGLNVVSTIQSFSAAIRGVSQSLAQRDIIGNDTFTGAPQEPARQAGVVAGGLTFGRGYFFQAPSETYMAGGGWTVGYGAGNKYSGSRSNIFADTGKQNIAFDFGG